MRAPVAGSGCAPACTAKVSKPYSAILISVLKGQASAQLFVRNHDVLAIGRALLQPLVPFLDMRNFRNFGSHGEIAIKMHAARDVSERQAVAGNKGPRGQLGIKNAQMPLGALRKSADLVPVALILRCTPVAPEHADHFGLEGA